MKKLLAYLALYFATTQLSVAQEHSPLMTHQADDEGVVAGERGDEYGFHLGGRFGLGESIIRNKSLSNITGKLAVSGGIATTYQFNEFVALNADLVLTKTGAVATGYTYESEFLGPERRYEYQDRFDFLFAQIPLTGQLGARVGNFFLRGYAGPSMNFKLIATESRAYNDGAYSSDHGYGTRELQAANTVSYSLVYGAGIGAYTSANRMYFLDFRVNTGTSRVARINGANTFMNYYTISAGYYF